MALKKKLKSIISEIREPSGGKSPEEDVGPALAQLAVSPAVAKFKEHINEFPNDPQADKEAIENIQDAYFKGEEFDTSQFELEKLPDKVTMAGIDEDRNRLRRQLQAVSKKVSELVLENHPAYAAELQHVMELQRCLQDASIICSDSRQQLSKTKQGFTTASLGLLKNYRKRQQLVALLKSLHTIKTLQRTDVRLREMVEEEDYPGAIQLCLECQKAASTFRHYKCISELSSKLQDTLEMIEESLDVALSRTCDNFDTTHYEKVQTAYRLLGKTQTAMDQLHMHFTSAIHNKAFHIVLGYVELAAGASGAKFQKRQYPDLCKSISPDMFIPCLLDLCKALWEVMKSYHRTILWHEQHEREISTDPDVGGSVEATFNRRYIMQKLEHGLGRIWGDVQQKVRMYIHSTDLAFFKYDEFIQVLDIINRLMLIGEEFCGSKSETLQDTVRKQSMNYFRSYHRARMEELHMFLENEAWQLCPVKATFSVLQLHEFKFMRTASQGAKTAQRNPAKSTQGDSVQEGFFGNSMGNTCPFDITKDEEENEEDVLATNGYEDARQSARTYSVESDSDDDIPDELKQDFVDEQTGEAPKRVVPSIIRKRSFKTAGKLPPIITNTTLNVCRLFGKYMQMMNVLKTIAFDVVQYMSQIFDYYLYTVYSFFGKESDVDESGQALSSKLRTTLKRIRDNLIMEDMHGEGMAGPGHEDRRDKVPHPHLSPVVDLSGPNTLYGLPERVVAAESLVFLAEQFEFLQSHLEATIPQAKKAFLQQFYSQTVSTASELRRPVYKTVAVNSINYDHMLTLMANVRWDIKDIMSQHSSYVDASLKEFASLGQQLEDVSRRVPITKACAAVIWELCILQANKTFVEGYASAKKCTNEGRALMQLDFQQYLLKVEKITGLRPVPGREYVENYVKAYYLPEAQLENWIRDHKEYTSRQLLGLLSCVPHINKRTRQKLCSMVEDMDRHRRL